MKEKRSRAVIAAAAVMDGQERVVERGFPLTSTKGVFQYYAVTDTCREVKDGFAV